MTSPDAAVLVEMTIGYIAVGGATAGWSAATPALTGKDPDGNVIFWAATLWPFFLPLGIALVLTRRARARASLIDEGR